MGTQAWSDSSPLLMDTSTRLYVCFILPAAPRRTPTPYLKGGPRGQRPGQRPMLGKARLGLRFILYPTPSLLTHIPSSRSKVLGLPNLADHGVPAPLTSGSSLQGPSWPVRLGLPDPAC